MLSVLLGIYLRVESVDHMVTLQHLTSSEGMANVSIQAAHLYVFIAMYEGSSFSLVSPTFVFIEL